MRPEALPEITKRDRGHRRYFPRYNGGPHQKNCNILSLKASTYKRIWRPWRP